MIPTPCNKVTPPPIYSQNGLKMYVHLPVGLADIGTFVPRVNKIVSILGH